MATRSTRLGSRSSATATFVCMPTVATAVPGTAAVSSRSRVTASRSEIAGPECPAEPPAGTTNSSPWPLSACRPPPGPAHPVTPPGSVRGAPQAEPPAHHWVDPQRGGGEEQGDDRDPPARSLEDGRRHATLSPTSARCATDRSLTSRVHAPRYPGAM